MSFNLLLFLVLAAKDQQRVRHEEVETPPLEEPEPDRLRKGKEKDDSRTDDHRREDKKDRKKDKKKEKKKRGKGRWAPEGEQWTFEN